MNLKCIQYMFILISFYLAFSGCRNSNIKYEGEVKKLAKLEQVIKQNSHNNVVKLENEVAIANAIVASETARIESNFSTIGVPNSSHTKETVLADLDCIQSYINHPIRFKTAVRWDWYHSRLNVENWAIKKMEFFDTRNNISHMGPYWGIGISLIGHTITAPFFGYGVAGHITTCSVIGAALLDSAAGWDTEHDLVKMSAAVPRLISKKLKQRLARMRRVLGNEERLKEQSAQNLKNRSGRLVMTYTIKDELVEKSTKDPKVFDKEIGNDIDSEILGGKLLNNGEYDGNYYSGSWRDLLDTVRYEFGRVVEFKNEKNFDHISYVKSVKNDLSHLTVTVEKNIYLKIKKGFGNFESINEFLKKYSKNTDSYCYLELGKVDILDTLSEEYKKDQKGN